MEKKLALLGPARPRYQERVEEIRKRCGYCWSGWSYKIDINKWEILKKQGSFHIYVHDIENATKGNLKGTGYVDYVLFTETKDCSYENRLRPSPNPECTPIFDIEKPHRLYAYITKEPKPKIPHKKYYEFINYDTDKPVSKKFPFFGKTARNAEFIYVIDEDI